MRAKFELGTRDGWYHDREHDNIMMPLRFNNPEAMYLRYYAIEVERSFGRLAEDTVINLN